MTEPATPLPLLSIVVPCYNEQEVLHESARRLGVVLASLIESGDVRADSHICFVDDGSTDRTWIIIEELSAGSPSVHGIRLTRNRGHQNALLAGLFNVRGDIVITIDADLQDDPNAISAMVCQYRGGSQIVYGVRNRRNLDSRFKRWTAISYYRLLKWMGVELVFNHADYRLMSRVAIDILREYGETNLFLRGIIPQLGFRSSCVGYDRSNRLAGETKYPLGAMLALAIQGITSFSTVPLRLITILGLLLSVLSCGFAGWALIARFVTHDVVPGWASTVVPIYFIGGIQLLCVGVVGEYLGKTYMETKQRPRYTIEKRIGERHSARGAGADGRNL
ncbi:MAG TPA: glycosyltransferase [Steroidobacteraceae bacterium]|nr:glycosyltransferase [Steroidobacteraceae bacterium]